MNSVLHDDSVELLPPNFLLQEKFQFSTVPRIYDYLLFVDFYENNGNVYGILGSSNIAGTYWEGSLFYFNDLNKLISLKDYSKYYVHSSTTDGKLLNEKTIAIAEDSGNLRILRADDDDSAIDVLKTVNIFQFPEQITEIAIWQNDENKVISSCGRTVTIWDVECDEKIPCFIADNIHLNTINSVDSTNDPNIFVTASSDRNACIWDTRTCSAKVLYSNQFSGLTKIRSNKKNSNYFAVGTRAGTICLIDKRKSQNDFITSYDCFNAPIECLAAFNDGDAKEYLAVAGGYGNNLVKVFDIKEQEIVEIYKNDTHKSAVKDLKWFNNSLFSCGFEKQLIKHEI